VYVEAMSRSAKSALPPAARSWSMPTFITTAHRRELLKLRIIGFVWLDEILDKLVSKHQVDEHEVVEVFEGRPKFRFVENARRPGENVYSAMGPTEAGRLLVVFFVYKVDSRALPVSARDMGKIEPLSLVRNRTSRLANIGTGRT
jgi:uncharacterized DUF497 family protein